MGKRVECPRCGSQNTKFLMNTTSNKLSRQLSNYFNSGDPLRWGEKLHECNDCNLEWNRNLESQERKEFYEEKNRNPQKIGTFWEEKKWDFWNTWSWAMRYGKKEKRMINLKEEKE